MYIITQHLGEDFDYGAKSNLEAFFISLKKTNQIERKQNKEKIVKLFRIVEFILKFQIILH